MISIEVICKNIRFLVRKKYLNATKLVELINNMKMIYQE